MSAEEPQPAVKEEEEEGNLVAHVEETVNDPSSFPSFLSSSPHVTQSSGLVDSSQREDEKREDAGRDNKDQVVPSTSKQSVILCTCLLYAIP